ncbi:class I SAM-dependent methyltransferase [Lysinibacillus sphaericus]|uniref:class I SAM-dependent methyltransferase n=1 Tax=Lysinibacillus sphaericus TaxID=1421 RepID=UPI001C5EB943
MKEQLHNWHNPTVYTYQQTIRQKIIGYDLIYDVMTNMLQNHPCTDRMLIVGAGGGQELLTLGSTFPSTKFTAVDTSSSMLQLAEQHINQLNVPLDVEWHPTDLRSLKIDEPFDIATCHLLLHFIEDLDEKKVLLKKIAESLKDGSVLFLSSINADLTSLTFKQQLSYWQSSMRQNGISQDDWQRFEQSFGMTTHPIDMETLVNLLQEAGFPTVIPYFKSHMIDALVAIKEDAKRGF